MSPLPLVIDPLGVCGGPGGAFAGADGDEGGDEGGEWVGVHTA